MKYAKLFLIITFVSFSSIAQVSEKEKKGDVDFRGYLKYMQTFAFIPDQDVQIDNLIHNRLNFKFSTNNGSRFVVEMRNRIFFGASVSSIPNYGDFINDYDGILPLEYLIVSNENVVVSSIFDRAYYEFRKEKFQLRIGRQRINWGVNNTWNPNDLFNSYNIYDFDYEEREGADAVRLSIYPNYMSSFDVAYKFTGDFSTDIFAGKYKFNKWNYDFQFLLGKFQEKIALGTGWAGSIKAIGFKGEATYFKDYEGDNDNLSASIGLDYSFKNGMYILGSYLMNTSGSNEVIDPTIQTFIVPNAEYLMPAKHNALISSSYMINPILNSSLGIVYGAGINSLTVFPTLTWNIKQNFDLDFIGQFFWQETTSSEFENVVNGIYWRGKWSF